VEKHHHEHNQRKEHQTIEHPWAYPGASAWEVPLYSRAQIDGSLRCLFALLYGLDCTNEQFLIVKKVDSPNCDPGHDQHDANRKPRVLSKVRCDPIAIETEDGNNGC
jgi:hypothetical protein